MKTKKRGKTRKKFDVILEYKKCFDYLSKSKKFIFIMIGIFAFFVLVGAFVPPTKEIYDQLVKFINELFEETQGMSASELMGFIIANNVQSTFFAWIGGIFLGIFPIFNAIANGYLLGFVSSASINSEGILSLWKLLPHGIFELPAVFISLGIGLKFGTFIFQKKKLNSFRDYFFNSLRIFLLIVIPLLVIAGIIEGILIYLLR